jgi:hypothetical protein
MRGSLTSSRCGGDANHRMFCVVRLVRQRKAETDLRHLPGETAQSGAPLASSRRRAGAQAVLAGGAEPRFNHHGGRGCPR